MRHQIGVENMMWGSDYPHPEGSWPVTRDQQLNALHEIPDEELAAILGGNAVDFYGLDAAQLKPHAERIGPEKSNFQKPRPQDAAA